MKTNDLYYNIASNNTIEVANIGKHLIYGCSDLKPSIITNSVTSIGNKTFYNCNGFTSITFAENVKPISISSNVFAYCRCFKSITAKNI